MNLNFSINYYFFKIVLNISRQELDYCMDRIHGQEMITSKNVYLLALEFFCRTFAPGATQQQK